MRPVPARTAFLSKSSATLLAVLTASLMLGGCSMLRHGRMGAQPDNAQAVQAQPAPSQAGDANSGVETIPFKLGVSSTTVEKLAKQYACTGGQGAGLISQAGPVEVYRMQCDSGKVFQARCELRQCKPM